MGATIPELRPDGADVDGLLYGKLFGPDKSIHIDSVLENLFELLQKSETVTTGLLTELGGKDPGTIDQASLMSMQANLSRWQIVSQMISNFVSGTATGLKNTVQNIGR